ncbi:MAG: MerC protein [Bryobacterales bacterium]|nr:MerC protein [Bryobacterales bacterium]
MKSINSFIDKIAIGVGAACGIHCLCVPLLLTISAISGTVGRYSETVEYIFLACSFLFGTLNLLYSYRAKHHRPGCIGFFVVGFLMICAKERIPGNALAATVGIGGGALIATAHFRNLHLCRRGICCGDAGCRNT